MTIDRDYNEQDPHFDGKRESVIADQQGKQFGIQAEKKAQKSPYPVESLKEHPEMDKIKP